jgi:hypothetical protein
VTLEVGRLNTCNASHLSLIKNTLFKKARLLYADLSVWGSDPVLNGSARFGPTLNPEPNYQSGLAPTRNFGPNFSPVWGDVTIHSFLSPLPNYL